MTQRRSRTASRIFFQIRKFFKRKERDVDARERAEEKKELEKE